VVDKILISAILTLSLGAVNGGGKSVILRDDGGSIQVKSL